MDTQALVTIVPSTFVLTILNLFIQLFLMKKFLFQPVKRILEERQKRADQNIRAAEQEKAEAEAVNGEYGARTRRGGKHLGARETGCIPAGG